MERYDPSGDGDAGPAAPALTTAETRLVAAVHLPADEVVIALVEGPDADTVAAVATARWRADRVTPARWLRPPAPETDPDETSTTGEQ
ncbi:hypothetical protein BJF78_15245 [Pseudonocardia sp. CNS-139]|nr:hypothetical protein BJF78_15245 [Pseudonocardia sp. CNS-139]